MILWFCEIISMWYFIYQLFPNKNMFISKCGELFLLQSAGKTEQQWMKGWVWRQWRMNGSSKALCSGGLWVMSVEKCREHSWFGKWKRSQERTWIEWKLQHCSSWGAFGDKRGTVKRAAKTSFWVPWCVERLCNCSMPFSPVNLSYNVGKMLQSILGILLWTCCWICLTASTPDCSREEGKKPHVK